MTKSNNRAKSAKKETAKRVNNRAKSAKKETAVEVIPVIDAVEVESVNKSLPATKETESGKVTSKEVLKAAGSLRAAVKEERRGANVTIRLIAERAAAGDVAAVDVLCALCDIPRGALYSLNIDTIRAAVNSWYPYYIETETRRVNVRAAGVWYTEKSTETEETEETAAKRVKRGYRAAVVDDYLEQLIRAAKCRAKGIMPRRVDVDTIYSDNKLSTAAAGITAAEIDTAKERRAYSDTAANVWKRDRNGYYI